jgi:hypothetical protein
MKIDSALSARMILALALWERHNQQAWWYLVDHNENDPNLLASLLGIDNEKLRSFLKEASLMTENQDVMDSHRFVPQLVHGTPSRHILS